MNIRLMYKASSVNGAASEGLLMVLFLVLIIGLQNESLLAHENTLSSYTRSLHSKDADEGALHKMSVLDQSTDSSSCRLTLNLIDAATKKSLSGLIRITTSDGHIVPLESLFNRGTGLRQQHPGRAWYVLLESTTVTVPRGRLIIEAFSGLETELAKKTIDLTDKISARVTLSLVRFHRATTGNWRNGNTHLHLMSLTRDQADQYLKSISQADGLELVFVSYLRRAKAERNYISNTYTKQQLQQLSGHGVTFRHGEEHRHNFGSGGEGYGHVMFLNIKELIRPVSIGPGIMGEGMDWPALSRGIKKANLDGATSIWCHNTFGFEDVPDWIAGILDAHNIFDGGSLVPFQVSEFCTLHMLRPLSSENDDKISNLSN